MTCNDYVLHENRCLHSFGHGRVFWRVDSSDGCGAQVCMEDLLKTDLADVTMIALLDADGIPLNPRAWTPADVFANMGREMLRGRAEKAPE